MSELLKDQKILSIAVDTGFGDNKIVINGMMITFPNAIADITKRENDYLGQKKKSFYAVKIIEGKTHLLGEYARIEQMENYVSVEKETTAAVDYSFSHFETSNYRLTLMGAIGIAITRYALHTNRKKITPMIPIDPETNEIDLTGWSVFVAVALPNAAVDNVWGTVKGYLVGEHKYSVVTNEGEFHIKFALTENSCMKSSQARAALIGLIVDDDGREIKDSNHLKDLPALIIDGGYVTMGLFLFNQAKKVGDDDSNTDYAMYNINTRVARELVERYNRDDIKPFNVEKVLADVDNGENFIATDDNKNTRIVPKEEINEIYTKAVRESFDEFIEVLNKKYNGMVTIKQIILTGGTGAVYYQYLKEYCHKHKQHLDGRVYLTDYDYMGARVEPQFAICVGLYKSLRHEIKRALKS